MMVSLEQNQAVHPSYSGNVIDAHVHYDLAGAPKSAHVAFQGGLTGAISLWDLSSPPPDFDADLPAWTEFEPHLLRCHRPDLSLIPKAPDGVSTVLRAIERAASGGCVGLKVWKDLGLWLRDSDGRRLTVDDRSLDRMWELAGELRLPVVIHVADPPELWKPMNPDNPWFEDVKNRPKEWHFHRAAPAPDILYEEFEALIQRFPSTTFIGAHFGCFLSNERLRDWFTRHDNWFVDTSAAISFLGKRDWAEVRALFLDFADRILFGTDLIRTAARDYPALADRWELTWFFERHFSYFESSAPDLQHPLPEQGPSLVRGLALPHDVLEQVYFANARRLFFSSIAQ